MFCPNCGFPYGPDDRFCGRCGAPLPARETLPQPQAAPLEKPAAPSRPKRRLLLFVLPVVLVLAAAAGALVFFLTRPAQPDQAFVLDSDAPFFFLAREDGTQIELRRGAELALTLPAENTAFRSADISADKSVFLTVDAEGTLYRADSQGCTALAEQVQSCFLSGDGSTAVWVDGENRLYLQREDDQPVTAAEDAAYPALLSYGGKALVWETELIPEDGARYYYLSLDDGQSQGLPSEDISPFLVTDGGTVYYISMRNGSLHLYAWKEGESTLLTDCLSLSEGLLSNRNGTELLYTTEDDSGMFTWFYREGEDPLQIGAFTAQSICTPYRARPRIVYISDSTVMVSQYNVPTLLEKALATDQGLQLLDRDGNTSALFPEDTVLSAAYASQDGNSLVVQTSGGEENAIYRFDDLWSDTESQVLAQGNGLFLLDASSDLSILLYILPGDTGNARDYYALRTGKAPVLLVQGNESAVVTMDNTILFSADGGTRLLLSDGTDVPISLELPTPEDGNVFLSIARVGAQAYIMLGQTDPQLSYAPLADLYAVLPDGTLTLLAEDVNALYSY